MRISVVIPAYNEAELLPRALAAILPQLQPGNDEVIVVNNNSTDSTADLAQAAGARVIHEQRQGVVFAMDTGLRQAQGDIVAFTDADTIVSTDWLASIRDAFTSDHVVGVTGPIFFDRLPLIAWIRRFLRTSLLGSNMAVRRLAGLAVGGFDTRYNLASDIAFGWRLESEGDLRYVTAMSVRTSARRFQSSPVVESFRYIVNYFWMVVFQRPLFWHFASIRGSAEEFDRRLRRQTALWATIMTVLTLVYLSAWPSSSDFGQIVTRVHTHQKVVALTFDDGPNGVATRQIVDILKSYHVPATFFEVGRSVMADPATATYVHDAGFPIENHSWDHSFRLPYMMPSHIQQELRRTDAAIVAATGTAPTFFRPPHGFRSPQLVFEVDRLHLKSVDWTVDPQDYNTGNPKTIVDRVVDKTRAGSIILLHDGLQDGLHVHDLGHRQGTIAALPMIIADLRAKGYSFVTIGQLLHDASDDAQQSRTTSST